MGKQRGRGGGMRFRVAGGAMLMLGEPESLLEESKLFLGELEPANEKLAILVDDEGFSLRRRRKKDMDATRIK